MLNLFGTTQPVTISPNKPTDNLGDCHKYQELTDSGLIDYANQVHSSIDSNYIHTHNNVNMLRGLMLEKGLKEYEYRNLQFKIGYFDNIEVNIL